MMTSGTGAPMKSAMAVILGDSLRKHSREGHRWTCIEFDTCRAIGGKTGTVTAEGKIHVVSGQGCLG